MTAAIETRGLTKQYGRVTALGDCTISVPAGRMSALVGPNGAGKTTLLRLLTGLCAPSAGEAAVLGSTPGQDPGYLAGIGFLAQDIPLYRRLTAQDHIGFGAHLNRHWDGDSVRARLTGLRIPLNRPVGALSGGQRRRSPWCSRWPSGRGCCCSTNRSRPLTRWPGRTSWPRWPRRQRTGT